MKPPDFSHDLNRLMDPYWRKARIAARLLIKREDGKPVKQASKLTRKPVVEIASRERFDGEPFTA